jgi:GNAT superfamily N-acetyltransferase
MQVTLRQVDDSGADAPLLHVLFAATHAEVFRCARIPEAQIRVLIDLQFRAQCAGYAEAYPNGCDHVVLVDGVCAGRLFTAESHAVVTVVDVAILPDFQGTGVGTRILQDLLDRARLGNRSVELQVIDGSSAERLYERLGFVRTGTHGLHHSMVWIAPETQGSDTQVNAA